jgi:uncharacterized protein (TIGR03437 family)
MALSSASDREIVAMAPFDIESNTSHQILVQRGLTYARPIAVNVATAQPEIHRVSGKQAFALGPLDRVADPASPVTEADRLKVYCAGLGAVQPVVPAGVAASAMVTGAVTLLIGGKSAEVKSAALSADKVGVYEIDAIVPAGVEPGNEVPVSVHVDGQASTEATIAVR